MVLQIDSTVAFLLKKFLSEVRVKAMKYSLHCLSQVVFHGMLFAFIYLALQKRQMISEGKGDALFSNRVSNALLFISIVSFMVCI